MTTKKNPAITEAARALGRIKSDKKATASRENGKKGGRPRNPLIPCACGCGAKTTRRAKMLRDDMVDTAESLNWAALSVNPMCELLPCARWHESDIPGYTNPIEGRKK